MRARPNHVFKREEELFLVLFAQLTALALDNVQLYTAAQYELDERRQAELRLQASEENLRRLNSELEKRVQDRTAELTRTNLDLIVEVTERHKAETALRESETRLRRITDNMLDLIVQTDLSGVYQYASPSHKSVMGYEAEDLVGKPMFDFVHPDDLMQVVEVAQLAITTHSMIQMEMRCRRADGHYVWLESAGKPLLDEAGQFVGAIIGSRDITKRKQAEAQILASLHEKEVLLKEIHHRVKNNLQIISSLLSLQSNTVADSQTLEILRESQNRVKSMALVHEKLYQSPDLARIDFAEYVRSLTAQLFRTYSTVSAAVGLRLNIENVWLDVDTAIPCGLIINELVSNALKHAFPDGQEGEIGVAVCNDPDGRIVLRVSDTGPGFPATIDFRNSPSLGLKLVNTLADQIGGVVELSRNQGTEFRIIFKSSASKARS